MFKKLVIDRRGWARGIRLSRLRMYTGQRCCLGIFCENEGISREVTIRKTYPCSIAADLSKALKDVLITVEPHEANSKVSTSLAIINDANIGSGVSTPNGEIVNLSSEVVREELITAWFATIGVEVEFIN